MRLLLLAGTPEAVQIAHAVAREDGVRTVTSVARPGPVSTALNMPLRIGGWGGDDAFADWLKGASIDAILDATHPFAARVSERTARVAAELGLPYVLFLRPAWTPDSADRWTFLNDESEAARHIPGGATVLLATGRRRLDRYGALQGRRVLVRVRDAAGAAFPFSDGGFLHRPVALPVPNEMAGLKALGTDWIVMRNSGGGLGAPLIEAAGRLGLPVGMIRRPRQPEAARIRTVSEAVAWVRRRRYEGE